jgi:hypothetical protein
MAEAAGEIPIVVGGLGRYHRCKRIYRTLGLAGQTDFRSGKDLMKDAVSRRTGGSSMYGTALFSIWRVLDAPNSIYVMCLVWLIPPFHIS